MKALLKSIPGMQALLETNVWGSVRHRFALHFEPRKNSHFTGFMRLPSQFDALSGPVIDFLLREDRLRLLRVAIIGCSNGAEAYSVASVLYNRHPTLKFTIKGYDINPQIIERAQKGIFLLQDEVLNNRNITREFVRTTFDEEGKYCRVKQAIKARVSFSIADVLDDTLAEKIEASDIIYAQNFLFHLEPGMASKALGNICRMLRQKAVLFIDGMDLPLRQKLTRKHHLVPLDYKIEEIHAEARWARAVGWPYHYWGLEPFSTSRWDWKRRYATMFLRTDV